MKIAFWSEEHQVETAFHMSLVACASAWMRPLSVAAISGGYQGKELEKSLIAGCSKSNVVRDFPDSWEGRELQRSCFSDYQQGKELQRSRFSDYQQGKEMQRSRFSDYQQGKEPKRNRRDGKREGSVLAPFTGRGYGEAGQILVAAEQQEYFAASGLDCLLGKRREELTKQAVLANMHPVIQDRMYCLPGSRRPEQEWWHKDPLFTGLRQILDAVEECFDVVFVDCGDRKDDFAQGVLQEADICVLNMDQESELIGDYYRNPPRFRGKVFFLIGNYFEDGLYTRRNLHRLYRVDQDLLGAIPYHPQLKEAARSGRTGAEIRNYIRRDKAQSYTGFGQELARAARLILQMAGIGA